MKQKLSNKGFIKVSTRVVRNEGLYIDNDCFHLYVRLCRLFFRSGQHNEFEFNHKALMNNCHIAKNETFKKYMNKLYEANLIKSKVEKLPRKGGLSIVMNDEYLEDKPFTQLSLNIFDAYESIGVHGFRLAFYYKSHINLHTRGVDRSFCFSGYKTIKERLKIGGSVLSEANDKLKRSKVVKIERHRIGHDNQYDNDELVMDRWNNHYKIREHYI